MARPHPLMPVLAAIAGIALFVVMDATMKQASLAGGVYNALLFRSLIATTLLFPLWRLSWKSRGGAHWPTLKILRLHGTRSAVIAVMALLWFWGLVRLPLAEAIAVSFIAPLIALFLAAAILGERVMPRAIVGSLLGFGGVMAISVAHVGHGSAGHGAGGGQGMGIAAVLGSAILYGWNLILQRQQAQVSDPLEVAFFQNLMIALILALAAPVLAHWPSSAGWGLLTAAASLAAISLMLLSWAYGRAEAQRLLPIEYTAFVWAALIGWLWFGETLDTATLLGGALIVIGCSIAMRGGAAAHAELTAV